MATQQERAFAATETAPKGFLYVPDFLTVAEQQELLDKLAAQEFKHDKFRGQVLKRSYAQFGYAYVSTGRKIEPAVPVPGFLIALAEKGLPHCPEGARFNQCIVTRYPRGAGINWHADAQDFGDCIMAVSLGNEARLQFAPRRSREASYEVVTMSGSLYVMCGPARWEYDHQVPAVKAERYSITFRWVAARNYD